MESSKIGYWLQVGANVGILIGLVLVGVQLQQTNEITKQSNLFAKADNASIAASFAVDREMAVMGENSSEALAKALVDPGSLNMQELVTLDAYHRQLLMELLNQAYQARIGILESDRENEFGAYIRLHLDYPFGMEMVVASKTKNATWSRYSSSCTHYRQGTRTTRQQKT